MGKILVGIGIVVTFIVSLPVAFMLLVPPIVASSVISEDEIAFNMGGLVVCNETQEINWSMWDASFAKAGALSGAGNLILRYSNKYGVDPVLFSAIAMHETGWGTSNAVRNYNNPGGLMNPATNWQTLIRYSSLEEGIDAMARTLNRLINERGLVTINELGSAYAPLDAANDPNGLNVNWVPTVTKFANEFGGLILNCELMGGIDIKDGVAWIVPHSKVITSKYGPRSCYGCSSFHRGIDVGGPLGSPIVAFADGVVVFNGSQGTLHHSSSSNMGSGYGYYIIIDHGNGVQTRYAHLMTEAIPPVGTVVTAGEMIGYLGSTGASSGPHLHFEILINGEQVDPMPYVNGFLNN